MLSRKLRSSIRDNILFLLRVLGNLHVHGQFFRATIKRNLDLLVGPVQGYLVEQIANAEHWLIIDRPHDEVSFS
jgi:hypothetical protein